MVLCLFLFTFIIIIMVLPRYNASDAASHCGFCFLGDHVGNAC